MSPAEEPTRTRNTSADNSGRGDELNDHFPRHYECEEYDRERDEEPRRPRHRHVIGHNWFGQNGLHNNPQSSDVLCNATAVPDGDTR